MPVTLDALKRLIVRAGVSSQTVDLIDPAVPLSRQGVDSIAHPLLILAVEDQFGVHISDEQALSLRTLNDFLALLD
jgi:acyl carrier protein